MTNDEAARVAVILTLSNPQRDAIMRGSIGDHSMATVRALICKGLMHHQIDSPNGRCGPVVNTEAGNAIRAHLQREATR